MISWKGENTHHANCAAGVVWAPPRERTERYSKPAAGALLGRVRRSPSTSALLRFWTAQELIPNLAQAELPSSNTGRCRERERFGPEAFSNTICPRYTHHPVRYRSAIRFRLVTSCKKRSKNATPCNQPCGRVIAMGSGLSVTKTHTIQTELPASQQRFWRSPG